MTPPAIEVKALAVSIGGAEILRDVSFTVAAGQFLSVIGPNGAGKSTLLRCIDGLQRAARGEIMVSGRPLEIFSRRQLAQEMSYVPQVHTEPLQFSVTAFVEMGRYPHIGSWGGLGAHDVAAVSAALGVTETAHLADRAIDSLSGGELQRVLIAAALAQGGQILLLDEPTSSLDYRHQVQVLALLDRLRHEQGMTIVAATHDLNSTVAHSDAVVALRDGRVVFQGAPAQVFDPDTLAAIYETEFLLVAGAGRELPLVLPRRAAP